MSDSQASHLTNPHDRFFRHFLADPERARAFVHHVLPPSVVAHLNLTTLQREEGSFVDAELRSHQGDMLFRVGLTSGGTAHVYVLFEHKSYPDRWVAWQLLRYMVRIWEREWRQQRRLSPIVPVVVYHGLEPWPASERFAALVEGPAALQDYVPDFAYRLYDLSKVEDDALWHEVVIGAWLAVMKYIQRPELGTRLEDILRAFWRWVEVAESETGVEALITVLRYIAEAREGLSEDDVKAVVKRTLPKGGEVMATLAQKWLEEGMQQGLEQGRREGLVQAIVSLLRLRLKPTEVWLEEITRRLTSVEDLKQLEELLLTAAQVESPEAFEKALACIVK